MFGANKQTLLGARLDYKINQQLNIGATYMRLTESNSNQKITIGNELISNTMYGLDINYSVKSDWLTKIVNKIPFLYTEEPSYLHMYGEFAYLAPNKTSNDPYKASYIDDFESNFNYMDIKTAVGWQISSTPLHFNEAVLSNDLSYGYNRALMAIYSIAPIFYQSSSLNPNVENRYLQDHRTRQVTEQEVFPLKEYRSGTAPLLRTLDLAYYPMLRGPYNYADNGVLPDGTFSNPQQKWAGFFKKLETTDFETNNIDFLEMWIMDPALTNHNKNGGEIYINLGSISEDILKDGRKSIENSLSPKDISTSMDKTVWGKVAKQEPATYSFENSDESRVFQDVGLDGLSNEEERNHHPTFLSKLQASLQPQAFEKLFNDPSTDDYIYFRGKHFSPSVSILDRYKQINGTQGNSRTNNQSKQDFDVEISAHTSFPDVEDIDLDHNMNEENNYYQYKLSMRPQDMVVGQNHIVDEQISITRILNRNVSVKWYIIRIPIHSYERKVGNIQNFKNLKSIRIFLTNFADTAVFRFAKLQFVKGNWKRYNSDNKVNKVISDNDLGKVASDLSNFYISNINIEENWQRYPIPYRAPPNILRMKDYSSTGLHILQNEQALSLQIINLKDGYGRAAFKTAQDDFRPYNKLEMFVHAEGDNLSDGDVTAFIRFGTDDEYHYYEYEQPLNITHKGATTAEQVWPEQNNFQIELKFLHKARASREKENINGQPWPLDVPYEYFFQNHKITILGNPDLSNIKFYLIGVKNPLKNSALSNTQDNGGPISGEFWFNELRLTEYNSKGGWAALATAQVQLADFATISASANKSTAGFGTLYQSIAERSRTNQFAFHINTSIELGKLFPPNYGISIPFYFNYSKQLNTPEYNPFQADYKLNATLKALNNNQRDSLLKIVQERSQKRGFSFNNVRKLRKSESALTKPWDIENFGVTFSYSEMKNSDFITRSNSYYNYRGILDYNYSSSSPNFIQPFKNIKSDKLTIIKDFSYNLVPSFISFRMEVNRVYRENTFRNNSADNTFPTTSYAKDFNINRIYGISWDLTDALRLDFNATNYAIVDEPNGRIDGVKMDTLWSNFWKLGRTTDYNHMMNFTYKLPIHKLPYLDWITITSRYGTQFNWQSQPFVNSEFKGITLGNSIQNNRTIQINPSLNFNNFYNKFRFIRNNRSRDASKKASFFTQLLTSIRQANVAYTQSEGTYLPGYLPKTNILGYNFDQNAPGIRFILGSQTNIIEKAIQNNWITYDSLQNRQFVKTYAENISGIIHVEPFRFFRLDLTFNRSHNYNHSSTVQFDEVVKSLQQTNPFTTGHYSISQITLGSSFRANNNLIQVYQSAKEEISKTLGENNIYSVGVKNDLMADGYSKSQQDVIVNALLNTFSKKEKTQPNRKPTFPLPNWRINYNGLSQLIKLEEVIPAIQISHTYQSQYIISSYQSNSEYKSQDNMVYTRDYTNNFLPKEQYASISIIERFSPLIGIDMRFRNALSFNSEYRQSKDFNLSIPNDQFVINEEKNIVFGLGYRKNNIHLPFGWYNYKKWRNDVNLKIDFAFNHRKTAVYRSETLFPDIIAGNRSITINPSLDYTINRYYNIRVFYSSNMIQPYTSQNYAVAYTYFGINLRLQFQ